MTNDVRLREVTEGDLPILFEQQLDPDAIRMAVFPARDRDAFMAHWAKILRDETVITRTILSNGDVAGHIGSFELDGERLVGYWLGKEYWGKGIATRALSEFLDHVKKRPLYARVAKSNVGSFRVLEKCGFTISGEDKFFFEEEGKEVEEFILKLDGDSPMDHNHEPSLETPRLLLRPMLATDIDDLLLIFTDQKVMAAFDTAPFDRTQMADWLQRNLDHQAQYGYGLFSVILKAQGSLIGDCGLEVMEVDGAQVAELGYDFRSDYWDQGLATEAAIAVRDYAFHVLGLRQLISLIRVGNGASQRVADKIGMRRMSEFARYGNRYWKYGLAHPEDERRGQDA